MHTVLCLHGLHLQSCFADPLEALALSISVIEIAVRQHRDSPLLFQSIIKAQGCYIMVKENMPRVKRAEEKATQ